MSFIQDTIEPGATIITDGWPTYRNVVSLGYQHVAYNVSKSGKQAHELLPACHRVSALLKRWLLDTHQGSVRPEHLDYYLDEFTFRFNRRYSGHRGLLFYRLLEQAVNTPPQPYTTLLSEAASERRQRNQKRARPKRPGGGRTRLDDGARRRTLRQVGGGRGGERPNRP